MASTQKKKSTSKKPAKAAVVSKNDLRMDYIEFPARDIEATKNFYKKVFGWSFTDYGPEYTSFMDGRLAGGFRQDPPPALHSITTGGDRRKPVIGAGGSVQCPLIVIYAAKIEATERKVRGAGGKVVKNIFEFPGGRRFHFIDPNGNELAVWSE